MSSRLSAAAFPADEPIIRRTRAGRLARAVLPTRLEAPTAQRPGGRTLFTCGLQRSGQHAVITWLCHCSVDALHFNDCRFLRRGWRFVLMPAGGRRVVYGNGAVDDARLPDPADLAADLAGRTFETVLYSLEDPDLGDAQLRKVLRRASTTPLLILRDPYNWLASVMHKPAHRAHALPQKIALLKQFLRNALGEQRLAGRAWRAVDFGRFVACADYRRALAANLGMTVTEAAEKSLESIPAFGGGSSFSGTSRSATHTDEIAQRWRGYADDPLYRTLLDDAELRRLTSGFFGELPHAREADRAMGITA